MKRFVVKKFIDNILYALCYPLRLIDKHTAIFSSKYFENSNPSENEEGAK